MNISLDVALDIISVKITNIMQITLKVLLGLEQSSLYQPKNVQILL